MVLLIAILSLIITLICLFEIATGFRKMVRIGDVPLIEDKNLPMVSVVIPACNEAATIEPALQSVLCLDYPNLEVVVINDRSTDDTDLVIKKVQENFPQLKIIEVSKLPENWLGKNHAMHIGAENAAGEYLLFTDADIVMEKTVLSRAIGHILTNKLDHLSMFFENVAKGGLLNVLFMDVAGGLLVLFKPWRAKDPKSRYFMGVGAFNLVKTSAYKSIRGHSSFAMHPIDDIMLGKLIKQNGFRQDCLFGETFITVKWYRSVKEFTNGLMKNSFALFNYNVIWVALGVFVTFLLSVVPVLGSLFASGLPQLIFLSIVILRMAFSAFGLLKIGLPVRYSLWSLISPYISIYIIIKATFSTLLSQSISWRGTTYPLDKLKRQGDLL